MLVLQKNEPGLFKKLQEKNLARQYDLLTTFIEIGLKQGPTALDKYAIWALNHVAVAGISQFGGRFREQPIYVGNHIPPHFQKVPDLMDQFIAFIHENWFVMSSTQLAAYGLWRLNWIHPFIEGNGRTARAVCYYLLCAKEGRILGGRKIVPERIRENRSDCIAALRASDLAWEAGQLDLSEMEGFLAALLIEQYREAARIVKSAARKPKP
jgi:Fic family protein